MPQKSTQLCRLVHLLQAGALSVMLASAAMAADIAYEGCDYAQGATVLNGGTGWAGPWSTSVGTFVYMPSFAIPQVTTTGQVTIGSQWFMPISRQLAQTVTNGWLAMMVQMHGPWSYISFLTGSADNFLIQLDNDELLVLRAADGSSGQTWEETSVTLANPTLLVVQLDQGTVRVFVNPPPGAIPPPPSAAVAVGNDFGTRPVEFNALKFAAQNMVKVDEIRIASTYNRLWPPRVSVRAVTQQLVEGPIQNLAELEVSVERQGTAHGDIAVTLQLGGTATPGVDYLSPPLSVTIPASASSVRVPFWTIDDTLPENSETIVVTLAGSPDFLQGTSSATITIRDDDYPSPEQRSGGCGSGLLGALLALTPLLIFLRRR